MPEHEYGIQKSKLKRKTQGPPLPFTFPQEQPMARRLPQENGKEGSKPVFLAGR